MSTATEAKKALPPYVPYKTFRNFIDSMKQAIPGRIDRSVMNTMSGQIQNQLLAALKYLELIDEQGSPQPELANLANAEGEERQAALRFILQASYPTLFPDGGFNLATATPSQFSEKFDAMGARGDTVRKMEGFFLGAVQDAGIKVSERITKGSRPRSNGARATRTRTNRPPKKVAAPAVERSTQPPLPGLDPEGTTRSTKVVRLPSGGHIELTIVANWMEIDEDETEFLLDLRKKLRQFEEAHASADDSLGD